MNNPSIKICGITQVEMAEHVALNGVEYIGIVFHPASPRYVNLQQGKAIAAAAKRAGASPVAVFVDHDYGAMQLICEYTDIQIVQLHGQISRREHHLLPSHYKRIYVTHALQDIDTNELLPERDMLLFDHPKSGQGMQLVLADFHYTLPFTWFIAGGLNATNVGQIIKTLKPNGVDVSSGVESSRGQKDVRLIDAFIHSVREVVHA